MIIWASRKDNRASQTISGHKFKLEFLVSQGFEFYLIVSKLMSTIVL